MANSLRNRKCLCYSYMRLEPFPFLLRHRRRLRLRVQNSTCSTRALICGQIYESNSLDSSLNTLATSAFGASSCTCIEGQFRRLTYYFASKKIRYRLFFSIHLTHTPLTVFRDASVLLCFVFLNASSFVSSPEL